MDDQLLAAYKTLSPNLERIYVVPNIQKCSRQNRYLYLLYKDLLEAPRSSLRLSSHSFFSPNIILKKLAGENSLLHHHWFEFRDLKSLLHLIWKFFWILVYKSIGGKIVWTIHNQYPHEKRYRRLNQVLRHYWARVPDRLHVHCQEAVAGMASWFQLPAEKFFVVQHPPYPVQLLPQSRARYLLNQTYFPEKPIPENTRLFLMFGYIAAYKGIREVVEIFNGLPKKKCLLIAGPVKKNNQSYFSDVEKLASGSENIILHHQYIPETDVPLFLNACDIAVFNYQNILSSGAVTLVNNYEKKMIIPNIGCLKELNGDAVFQFDTPQALKRLLETL